MIDKERAVDNDAFSHAHSGTEAIAGKGAAVTVEPSGHYDCAKVLGAAAREAPVRDGSGNGALNRAALLRVRVAKMGVA